LTAVIFGDRGQKYTS